MNAEAREIARRAPRITAEDVFAAADALLIEGHRPTIDRVRMKLGRGSPNTINEHLDRWWSQLGARLRELPAGALPGIPESIASALLNLWTLALREAHAAHAQALQSREAQLNERSNELEFLEQRLREREAALTARNEATEGALTVLRGQLSETQHRAQQLETALHEREQRLTELTTREVSLRNELSALQARLNDELNARLTERADLQARSADAEARALREIDRARQELKEAQRQHAATEKTLRTKLEQGRTELKGARDTVQRLECDLSAAQALAAARTEQLQRLEGLLRREPSASPVPNKEKRRASKPGAALRRKR